jgi:hypothetical protein
MTRPYLDDDLSQALFGSQNIPEALRRLRAWTESKPYRDFSESHNLEPDDWLTAFKFAVLVKHDTGKAPQPKSPPSHSPSNFDIDIAL